MTAASDLPGTGDGADADDDVWVFPTSFPQRRMWLVEQLVGGGALHNLPVLLRIEGDLDVTALESALNDVVGRHEMLRTGFVSLDGEPTQVVSAELTLELRRVDLSDRPATQREKVARELAEEDCRIPFDLTRPPLLRAALYAVDHHVHLLSLVLHHIVTDGWSMGVLVREIATAYRAAVDPAVDSLPGLPIQYGDFAHWQRQTNLSDAAGRHLAYWVEKLSGDIGPLELPTDRARPSVRSTRGAQYRFVMPADLVARVRAFSAGEGVTPFMTLLSAFTALLHHYTSENDIVIGSPVANRTRAELEPLIGFFVNTLALRTDTAGNPRLRELVHRVRDTTVGALAHQDLPFETLVERLGPGRSLSHTPLFQVMFEFGNAPMPDLTLPGLAITAVPVERAVAEFDLSLSIMDDEGDLTGLIEYCADLFDPQTMDRFARCYLVLLGAIVDDPDQLLGGVSLLSDLDRVHLPDAGSVAVTDEDRTVTDLLLAAENVHADRLAVVCGDRSLTYRELGSQAEVLAAILVAAGVGRDSLVVVCLGRSVELGVAVRGVLAAGAAFVPVDPGEPAERLATILRDAGPRCVLADESTADLVPAGPWQVLRVDQAEQTDVVLPDVAHRAGRSDAAYAIYTSGSSGTPKGVVVDQGAVADYCVAFRDRVGLGPADRFLQFAALGFDVLIEETLPTWIAGGVVVLPEGELFLAYDELTTLLAEQAVTVAELPTAYWHDWVRDLAETGNRPPAGLRAMIIGGERVVPERLTQWADFGVPLFHVFGLTENTVTSTVFDVGTAVPADVADNLPIGLSLANTTSHVLNPYLRPVPAGVPGELYLGGTGVARGYLNRPALTSERFVADPFSARPGARMYRTGDRVRRDAEGRLCFLGRVDEQVKIRGYRVEPGEIEAALRAHERVADAAVSFHAERLVGHVVPAPGKPRPDLAELATFLRHRLPEYMVPRHFDLLDALPLTHNGKIDDRALAVRAGHAVAPGTVGAGPRTELEDRISAVWRELLGVERVDRDVNFFDLGGHSLLAARLQARLRTLFGRDIPLVELFTRPTVASQAAMVDEEADDVVAVEDRGAARRAAADRRGSTRARRRSGRANTGGAV